MPNDLTDKIPQWLKSLNTWKLSFATPRAAGLCSTDKRLPSTWPRRAATWRRRSRPRGVQSPPMAPRTPARKDGEF